MKYAMTILTPSGLEVPIPVLPEKIAVASPGKNDTAEVLQLGEVLLLHRRGLRTITWNSFFPVSDAPYVSRAIAPHEAVEALQEARNSLRPCRFILTGSDLDCNMPVGVESFDYEERAGEVGDIYYTIKLREWVEYAARRLVLGGSGARVQKPRGTLRQVPKSYTVLENEDLWLIARKLYGDASRYKDIYAQNKEGIDAKNKGTGNPCYTVYPGQALRIP